MATWDIHANLASTSVTSPPTPPSSGSTLVVNDGSVFPATPFNILIWPSSSTPTPANSEIARVTSIATNTLTITRGQESSAARAIISGDNVALTITKKTITDIEGALSGTTGYTLTGAGANTLPVFKGNGAPVTVSLVDGATVALDASLGTKFRLVALGNRTILTPTNPADGQKMTIEHFASGGGRTLSLTTGATGSFRFGGDITSLAATASGKTDYIGCVYNGTDQKWDVVAVTTGF